YTKGLRVHNQKWCFRNSTPRSGCVFATTFRRSPAEKVPGPAVGKRCADVLEFRFRRVDFNKLKQALTRPRNGARRPQELMQTFTKKTHTISLEQAMRRSNI